MINKDIAKKIIQEYKRPWKLFSLFIGIAILIFGSIYLQVPDWDIPICFIMAFFAYLTASWCMHVIVEWQWKKIPLMAFYTWFSTDGCYWLYWLYFNPDVLVLFREINFYISITLFCICGAVWYYRGSIKQFKSDL